MMDILNRWHQQTLDFLASLSSEVLLLWAVLAVLLLTMAAVSIYRQYRSRQRYMAEVAKRNSDQERIQIELEHRIDLQQRDFEVRSNHSNEQLGVARRRLTTIEDRLQDAQAAYHSALNERDVAQEKNTQVPILQQRGLQLERQLDTQRTEASIAQSDLSAMTVKLTEERKAASEKLSILEDARERLSKEFEILANRIFEEKSEKMQKHNTQTLENTLNPLRDQLTGFKKKVEDVYDKESRERLSLLHEVNSLKDLNQKMSADALNLTKALKGDNKLQGNWGELVLERVLEDSGLKKGREYEIQVNLSSADGQRRLPDVIIHLPDERDLVIDSKVSLLDYERYCSADDDAEKKIALHAHIQSMRRHVKGLSIKDYAELEGVRTLDFVFVFVPVEPAFLLAFEHDQSLFREAYDRNVIVVSPTTLLATLRTVQNLWRYDSQNKNAEKIARQAGGLHDQFVLVLESMEDMGRQIDKARTSYDAMMNRFSKGKGNLVNRTRELEKLGAKTKRQLPKHLKASEGLAEAPVSRQENLAKDTAKQAELSTESD